jgi:hypothetical protein
MKKIGIYNSLIARGNYFTFLNIDVRIQKSMNNSIINNPSRITPP